MSRRVLRPIPVVTALLIALVIAAAPSASASGGGRRFPVPSCGWASAGFVGRTLHDPVRALKPNWTTQLTPVLTCEYAERSPRLQLGDVALLAVQFRELQRLKPPRGAVSLPHLGSCAVASVCPEPGRPAWMVRQEGGATGGLDPYAVPFVAVEALEVQDGLNEITVVVEDPDGPLPVADETATLEQIVKQLLPRFHWS